MSFESPSGKKGEYVCLKAEVDLVVIVSACPQVSGSFFYGVGEREWGKGDEMK